MAYPLKVLLITYNCISDMTPEYLCELVIQLDTLAGACVSTQVIYGDFTFSIAAPTLWNRLPTDIRNASSLEQF